MDSRAPFVARSERHSEHVKDTMIFHLVPESEFRAQLDADSYRPTDLAEGGFVHCSTRPALLPVADDYFSDETGPLLVLEIDATQLVAEVRYEAAAPMAGTGFSHLDSAPEFPHIYGPVMRKAIRRVGVLSRTPEGFQWPTTFLALAPFLARS